MKAVKPIGAVLKFPSFVERFAEGIEMIDS